MGLLRRYMAGAEAKSNMRDLLEMLIKGQKLEQLLSQSELGKKPIYGAEISALPAYDPAQAKPIAPPPGAIGPTFGEAGALSEIYKNLPLSSLIQQKAGPGMWSPFAQFFPPGTMEKMTAGPMYPTEATRAWEQYLPKLLQLFELTQKPRRARPQYAPEYPAAEIGEIEEEELPSEVHKIAPIAKMILGEMRRIYGTLEEEKPTKIETFKYGEGLRRGAEVLREPIEGEGKARAGILGEYDEWVKTNPGKTLGDYITWKANLMANAKIKAIQSRAQTDPDAKKAFDMAKFSVQTYLEQNPLAAMDMDMDQISDMFLERYNKNIERIKGRRKAPPKDVLDIQQRLDLKMKERGQK